MPSARVNGVNLAYELHGTGDPLVLIHGAQSDRSIFANLLPDFVDQFQVLVFDQRGSGQSEKPDIEYTMGMIADDTAALMEHIGFSSAHMYGVSMGGMIAQEVAIRYGAAVRSLVLGCTTPGGPHAISLEGEAIQSSHSTAALSAEERGRALAETAFTKGYIDQHPELIPTLIEARKKQPLDPIGFAHRMKAAYRHNTFDRLSQITCPTLVITGKDDALIAWENSQLLAEHIADSELVVLEPAGHVFWVEQPARSREAIRTFLQKQKG
ncbi:MAG: alpha/beta fold hydrolase [Desulfurellaceae bacterium]|nr:alpha/beta fold hydrolase [Desulfurellaceae bacterium]